MCIQKIPIVKSICPSKTPKVKGAYQKTLKVKSIFPKVKCAFKKMLKVKRTYHQNIKQMLKVKCTYHQNIKQLSLFFGFIWTYYFYDSS